MQNDETEQFEQRLKRQPLHQIPAEWRREILSVAEKAQPKRRSLTDSLSQRERVGVRGNRPVLNCFGSWLRDLFWPHPVAWAGLAAIWIFILGANVSLRDNTTVMAKKTPPPSPEMIAELRQQQRLLAELIGPNDVNVADRPKPFVPQPRSERVVIFTA